MEKIVGPQLSDELKQQFMRISEANWSNQGEEGQKVLADFNNLLSDPDRLNKTNFYLVQHGSEVLGFFRLDTLEDNSLYFGSVNARSDLAGAKIGETLLDKIFTSVAQGRLVKADCNPKAPISSKYIGKLGFVATNLTDYAEPGDTFEITRDDRPDNPEKGRIYEFQGKSYKELAALESAYQDHPRARLRHYTFPQEYNIFIGEASNLLHQEPKTIISAYQQERNRREDGSYGVVIGFEQVDLPVAPDQGVSRQEELVSR